MSSTWTDEHLGDLLTATFVAHEDDADPAVAQRIALTTTPTPRRAWPVVAAAGVVVLLVAVTVRALWPSDTTTQPSGPRPVPVEVSHHRTVAAAVAAELVARVPVPPGADPRGTDPPADLRLRAGVGAVDPTLTQTAWWIVPMSYRDLVAWYGWHTPADVRSTYTPGSASPAAAGVLSWSTGSATSAYTAPGIVVSYARRGAESTAVRVDVTLAARDDRTAATFVSQDVTRIDITRTDIVAPVAAPATVSVTSPGRVRRIVNAFNALDGAPSGAARALPCGSPVGDFHLYSLTFHWPGHSLAVGAGQILCGIGRRLTLDGVKLAPRLEDTDAFDALLEAAF
jgi:hypothetical protein